MPIHVQTHSFPLGHGLFYARNLTPSYPNGLSLKDFTKLSHKLVLEVGLEVGGDIGLRAFSPKVGDNLPVKPGKATLPVELADRVKLFANVNGLSLTGAANILYVSGLNELGQLPERFRVSRPIFMTIPAKSEWGMNRCSSDNTRPACESEQKRGRGRPRRENTILTMLKIHPQLVEQLDDFGGNPFDLIERWCEAYAGELGTLEPFLGVYDCRPEHELNPARWRLFQLRLPAWFREILEEDQRDVGGTHSLSFLRLMVAIGKLPV